MGSTERGKTPLLSGVIPVSYKFQIVPEQLLKKLDPHFARKQGKERHVTCPWCITRKHNGISNSILAICKAKNKPFGAIRVPDNIMA